MALQLVGAQPELRQEKLGRMAVTPMTVSPAHADLRRLGVAAAVSGGVT